MTPTMHQHQALLAGGGGTVERDTSALVGAADGTHRAHGRLRAVLVGACLGVLLTGCSLDVGALRENIETHWSGVEKTSPTPSTAVSPTADPSNPAGAGLPPTSGPCPRGGSGVCRL